MGAVASRSSLASLMCSDGGALLLVGRSGSGEEYAGGAASGICSSWKSRSCQRVIKQYGSENDYDVPRWIGATVGWASRQRRALRQQEARS